MGSWPIRWRQLRGDRANALQDSGLAWHEAERRAFEEACLRMTRGDERPR